MSLTPSAIKKLKVDDLKEQLEKRNLDTSGKKADLVDRLIKALEDGNDKEESPKVEKKATGKRKNNSDEKAEEENPKKKPKEKYEESVPAPLSSKGADWDSGVKDLLNYITDDGWKKMLQPEFEKPYFKELIKNLEKEVADGKQIFPVKSDVFNALNFTPFDKVKVVIIGQDPYFNPGQAHGLCFSVQKGVAVPPSLKTMYKELERTIPKFKAPKHGYLEKWARQGVLMLNATLTVEVKKPNSHAKFGWQTFTDAIIKLLSEKKNNLVFLLWGGFAQKKGKIASSNHHILESPHPSPMAGGGFNGCNCFAECNKILEKENMGAVDWTLDP